VKSSQAAEAALMREKERRNEEQNENRAKIDTLSTERNNLQAQVQQLQDHIASLQQDKQEKDKIIEDKDTLLKNSEARVRELMNNSASSEVVQSLDEENQELKQKMEAEREQASLEKQQLEVVFNDIKRRLQKSNAAGRQFRDQVTQLQEQLTRQALESENDASLTTAKDAELEDYRAYVKELRDQLTNQEVVFKLQLQEMGHLIDEMREREKTNTTKYQRTIQELQEQHNQEMKSQKQSHQQNLMNPQGRQQRAASYEKQLQNFNPIQANQWEKTINTEKTQYGFKKLIITWKFVVDGTDQHEVTLQHNTYTSGGKSKRVLLVDGVTIHNDKSDTTTFYCTLGHHVCQVFIREPKAGMSESGTQFEYDLYVDKMPFEDLRREYYIEMQRQRAQNRS